MDAVFTQFINLNIVASFLILAVIILRLFLTKAPKWTRCIMWAMVAVRLAIPFSFESNLSLVPNAQKLNSSVNSSVAYIDTPVTTHSYETTTSTPDFINILSCVWIIGIAVMIGYMVFSYIKVHRMVRESINLRDNLWICDHISSPFVLGIFRPKIYLLSSMSEKECEYVISHEQAHLNRLDNIWKPIGYILLSIYWFNPLCWIAYRLFIKDIELSCDESVVKSLDTTGKKEYSTALLTCSSSRSTVSACPLAFGENNVKQRIKSVLSYKKPTLYIIIIAVVLCAVVAVLFMTNPVSQTDNKTETTNPTVATTQPVTTQPVTISIKEKLNLVYSDVQTAMINNNLEKDYINDITKSEIDETNKVVKVYIKNLNNEKQEWFKKNISDSEYISFVNVVEETTQPTTAKPTEPPTEAVVEEEYYYDDSYDDSYYYEDNYSYDDSYYYEDSNEENNTPNNIVPITPFDFEKSAEEAWKKGQEMYGGY